MFERLTVAINQEITRLLRDKKALYRVPKGPPLVSILSRLHPIQTCFPKIQYNVSLSMLMSYK